jgi:hypothetical protein
MLERLFGGGNRDEVADRIARRDFATAVKLIRKELDRDPSSFPRRIQLADVLALSGRTDESVQILNALAQEMVSQGFVAKAIALLKKSQRVLPGQADVETKLAALVLAKDEVSQSFRRVLKAPPVIGDEPDPVLSATPSASPSPAPFQAPAAKSLESELSEMADEIVASGGTLPAGTSAPASSSEGVVLTPLFGGFSQDELVEVIRGLKLQSFEPGDVVVTEGESGGSLFIVSTGLVKVFIRDQAGRSQKVRELGEGAFFGEVSVVTRNPRSATVTAATRCELLELDRKTLASIVAIHPHVWSVMLDFCQQRTGPPAAEGGSVTPPVA